MNSRASDYQVEAIVFEHVFSDLDSEIWQNEGVLPSLPDSIYLDETSATVNAEEQSANDGFKLSRKGDYKLSGIYNALNVSSKYRPLLHVAWEQPALEQGEAEYVRLTVLGSGQMAGSEAVSELAILDGVIRIRSAHFLHADVNLIYLLDPLPLSALRDDTEQDSIEDISLLVPEYQALFAELEESRRLKLNELYYFDHPGFGLILRVSRLEQSKAE